MRVIERLKPALLRWDRILAAIALAVPFLFSIVAGFLWMAERGILLPFVLASIALGGIVGLVRYFLRRSAGAGLDAEASLAQRVHVREDPEWTAQEQKAFADACAFIEEELRTPRSWQELQPLALDVVDIVARSSSAKEKGRLDFTVPEALLLVERVAGRFRTDIRTYVPMADAISISALETAWRHRDTLKRVVKTGNVAWRVARAIKSLPIAVLREIEGAIAQGHANFITGEGTAVIQALLLEEVAAAAIDLYSGRLRFSDSELLDLRVASGDLDRDRLALRDAPVRIAVAGQVSAGKSSLINALLRADLAETDVTTTTDKATTYEVDLGGVACVMLDLPGLDGTRAASEAVMQELTDADMVIWVTRANRPARDMDRKVLADLRAFFADRPERRAPPLFVVATCVDVLAEGWPYPEHLLPPDVLSSIARTVAAIGADIHADNPIPVVLTDPEWNVEAVRTSIEGALIDALMTQRNRVRAGSAKSSLPRETLRAGRGFARGISVFGPRQGRSDRQSGDGKLAD